MLSGMPGRMASGILSRMVLCMSRRNPADTGRRGIVPEIEADLPGVME